MTASSKGSLTEYGVTLLELIIALCILSILVLQAMPIYGQFIITNRISTATSELHGALLYARSEALKRGGNVIICRSSSTLTENPHCEAGTDSSGRGWGAGWMVFHDKDANRKFNAGDEILTTRSALFETGKEGAIIAKPATNQLIFNGTGQVFAHYMSFVIQRPQHDDVAKHDRYICLASGGRARVSVLVCNQ